MINSTRSYYLFILAISGAYLVSCNSDDTPLSIKNPIEEPQETKPDSIEGNAGSVIFYNRNLIYDGYILIDEAQENRVFLIDKNGDLVFEYPLKGRKIGNDAVLLPNGSLLASIQAADAEITFGGFAGKIQVIGKDGETIWNFDYSKNGHTSHHDVELLPNGNIITIVWERMPQEVAIANGSNLDIDVFPEAIIEINPETDTIVWEWHAWDHLVQDFDATKLNYGNIAENPQLINFNYVDARDGDIMHANGIAYDALNDLIYLSVNFYSEVWVIDHSTSIQEAAQHDGGNFGLGGDLVYRFGNPSTQNISDMPRLFINNHYPNLFEPNKMLIFTNGGDLKQSTVYELDLPDALNQKTIPVPVPPEIAWSFTNTDLYSGKVSGAVRLPNGNTLITEGDFGVWEVTHEGEVVWKFTADGFFWRAYHYEKNAPEIIALGIPSE
jgi:outer membrane protein assembly factor BamB